MKRMISLFCTAILILSTAALPATAATKYIPTNIPSSFPTVKQDPSFTVVNFWHAMTGNNAIFTGNIVNWYNATQGKKSKVYVKAIFQGAYADITTKIQATIQANSIKDFPDLVQLNSGGAFSVKESKYVIPIQEMMDSDKTFSIKDKLNKNALQACTYKGKQFGMPFSNSMIAMHYNADAFKSVGLDPTNPPKTIADFAEAAAKLVIRGKGSKPVRYGGSCWVAAYQLSTWIPRQNGGTYQFDNEDGRLGSPKKYLALTEGTLKATLTEWKKVCDTNALEYANNSPRLNYESGLTAMYMESMINYDSINQDFATFKDKSKIFDTRMARIPTVNANDSTAEAIGGSAVFMFDRNNAKTKAATWDFVKFLTTTDVSAYWHCTSGYFPLNSDAMNTKYVADVWAKLPQKKVMFQVRTDSAKNYKFQEPWMPSYFNYDLCISTQASLLAQGKITVDKATEAIAKKADAVLKTYWDANS